MIEDVSNCKDVQKCGLAAGIAYGILKSFILATTIIWTIPDDWNEWSTIVVSTFVILFTPFVMLPFTVLYAAIGYMFASQFRWLLLSGGIWLVGCIYLTHNAMLEGKYAIFNFLIRFIRNTLK